MAQSYGIKRETFISFLAFDGDVFVGIASACLYAVLPGKKLPRGKNAYIWFILVSINYRLCRMSLNTAVNVFVRQAVLERAIPFKIKII